MSIAHASRLAPCTRADSFNPTGWPRLADSRPLSQRFTIRTTTVSAPGAGSEASVSSQ